MRTFADEIRNKITASSLIGKTVSLKPKGKGEFTGLCPFHQEKTPSFTVSDDKGFYHCFGCGEHGDIVSFKMKLGNLQFKEALEELAKDAGIPIPKITKISRDLEDKLEVIYKLYEHASNYYHVSLRNTEALKYLKDRKISDTSINKFKLGFAPSNQSTLLEELKKITDEATILSSGIFMKGTKGDLFPFFRNRVLFPIYNRHSRVIAFGGRSIDGAAPKYLNSSDNPIFKKGNELYGLNFALSNRKQDFAILVEGYMDAITVAQHGFENVVAPLGTAVKLSQIELLWTRGITPYLCLDNDSAGERATYKTAIEALETLTSEKTLKIIKLKGAKDPDEYLQLLGPEAFAKLISSPINLSDFLYDYELNQKPIKTPEQKSNFKKRLEAIIEKIKDSDLKQFYKSELINKFYTSIRYQPNSKRDKIKLTEDSARAIATTMHNSRTDEALIMLLITKYPAIINNEEVKFSLENMDFKSEFLDKLRDYLLSMSEVASSLVTDHLQYQEYLKILQEHTKADLNNVSANFEIKTEQDALQYVSRLIKLNTLSKLQDEISVIFKQLQTAPSEEIFNVFSNLKNAEEQIKIELGII